MVKVPFVGAVFLYAAVMKAWHPGAFEHVLAYLIAWTHLSGTLDSRVLGLTLIAGEAVLGGALLLHMALGRVVPIAIGVLGAFSIVLGVLALSRHAPACGCFGLGIGGRVDAGIGLARNALLMSILIIGACPSETGVRDTTGGRTPGGRMP